MDIPVEIEKEERETSPLHVLSSCFSDSGTEVSAAVVVKNTRFEPALESVDPDRRVTRAVGPSVPGLEQAELQAVLTHFLQHSRRGKETRDL